MGFRAALAVFSAALLAWPLFAPKTLLAGQTDLAQTAPKGSGQVQKGQPQSPKKKQQARPYLHPIRKFAIIIPPGADFSEKARPSR